MPTDLTLSRGSIVAAVGEQTSCRLGDEVVVLDLRAGVYYGLNAVAARVWALVQRPIRVVDILSAVLDEYDADAASCRDDVLEVLHTLAARGLLAVDNDASS